MKFFFNRGSALMSLALAALSQQFQTQPVTAQSISVAASSKTYHNPIIPNQNLADPHVIRVDGNRPATMQLLLSNGRKR